MRRLKEFWKKLNYPSDILDNLLAEEEEGSELDDPITLAETFAETQRKLILNNSGLFSKEHMDAEFNTHRKKLASDINKALGMGYTRSQLDEMGWDTFKETVKEFHDTNIKSAAKITDDEINNTIHELKSKNATLLEQYRDLEETIEDRVKKRTEILEAEINNEATERLFHETFNDPEFKWIDKRKKIDQSYIKNQVLNTYEIQRDGRLTQNGGKDAVNFSGNGHFKHLKEAVKYLYENEGMSPQHKGGNGDDGPVILGKIKLSEGEKLGKNTQELSERVAKSRSEAV